MRMTEKHKNIQLQNTSRIQFHPLHWGKQTGSQRAVIRWDTDEGIYINQDQFHVLRFLMKGYTIAQAAHKFSEEIEIIKNFVRYLHIRGFITAVDAKTVPDTFSKIQPLLPHTSQKWFNWSISVPFLLISFLFIVSGFWIALTTPSYLPTLSDFFWTDDLFLILLSIHVIILIITIIHECAHFVVTKAVGGQGRIALSTRFVYFVVETQHYHLAVIPKAKRYLIYISGIYSELMVIALIMWIFALFDTYALSLGSLYPIFKMTILLHMIGLIWQFFTFLQTDLYNILSDFMSHDNLYDNTRKFIASKLSIFKHTFFAPFTKIITKIIFPYESQLAADNFHFLSKKEKIEIISYSIYVLIGLFISAYFSLYLVFGRDFILFWKSVQIGISATRNGELFFALKSFATAILIIDLYILTVVLILKRKRKMP